MKILIVDDDFQNRDILKTRLAQAGYETAEAVNGDEGIAFALKENFDLILLDVMMPKKDGWQVCKSLKSHPRTKGIPVIVITALASGIDELRTWESGADDYVQKPVNHEELIGLVKKLTTKETEGTTGRE